jgi:hypothetical protein
LRRHQEGDPRARVRPTDVAQCAIGLDQIAERTMTDDQDFLALAPLADAGDGLFRFGRGIRLGSWKRSLAQHERVPVTGQPVGVTPTQTHDDRFAL